MGKGTRLRFDRESKGGVGASFGERCWQYLFREKSLWIYRGMWVAVALVFANVKVDLVWAMADTLNGLMAIPNLIGLLLLSPMVFKVTREYFDETGKPLR